MNGLTFDYQGDGIRTAGTPDAPMFVLPDVCRILEISNARDAAASLDADEVVVLPVATNDGSDRELPTNCVTEAGLYSLILRSRKPQAKEFKRWVTHEVLPAIRKTGGYQVAAKLDFSDPLTAAQLYIEAETARRQAQQKLIDQAPAVAFARQVEVAHTDTGIQHFAKMCGWGPYKLFAELRKRGILFKQDGDNVPKQELIQRGYFKVRQTVDDYGTHARTMLTGKGVLWLSRILKVNITPMLLDDVGQQEAA